MVCWVIVQAFPRSPPVVGPLLVPELWAVPWLDTEPVSGLVVISLEVLDPVQKRWTSTWRGWDYWIDCSLSTGGVPVSRGRITDHWTGRGRSYCWTGRTGTWDRTTGTGGTDDWRTSWGTGRTIGYCSLKSWISYWKRMNFIQVPRQNWTSFRSSEL